MTSLDHHGDLAAPDPDRPEHEIVASGSGNRDSLPTWPLTMALAAYGFWWLTGLGDFVLILMAVVMIHQMISRRVTPAVPRGFGVWLLFVVWVAFSVVGIDSGGRLIGFTYRGMLYAAATVAFVYVWSDRKTFTVERVATLLTGFWFVLVAGGYLGVIAPLFTIRTPLAYVLPQGLLSNELVGEMAIRRATQFNPDAFTQRFPRPSAPFVYTNGWGNAYSVLTPIVIASAMQMAGRRRVMMFVVIAASTVPAFLTLNRGMFIGLTVAGLYMAFRGLAAGNVRILVGVALAAVVAAGSFALLPVGDRLESRLETSSTTEDRASLYEETLTRTLESPVFGYGAPRPSESPGLPSAGTQGHIWMVIFSHGFPAAALFLLWLVVSYLGTMANRSGIGLAMHAVIVVISVEILYYGLVGMGLVLMMIVTAAAWRRSPEPRVVGVEAT